MRPLFIGYNNSDEYGSNGWWEEGQTERAIMRRVASGARDCGFDSPPPLQVVDALKLCDLTLDDFEDLVSEWGSAYANSWSSERADALIRSEAKRRGDELRLWNIGRQATKLLGL